MKNVDLSMYAKDLDLPVENYIFEEILKPEEDIDDSYRSAYQRLVKLEVIHETVTLFLHVKEDCNLAQFIAAANACAKSDTGLIVVHHQDDAIEPKYQMVLPKVIYHSV